MARKNTPPEYGESLWEASVFEKAWVSWERGGHDATAGSPRLGLYIQGP